MLHCMALYPQGAQPCDGRHPPDLGQNTWRPRGNLASSMTLICAHAAIAPQKFLATPRCDSARRGKRLHAPTNYSARPMISSVAPVRRSIPSRRRTCLLDSNHKLPRSISDAAPAVELADGPDEGEHAGLVWAFMLRSIV